ncbi:ABC transporter substrate-binding protein [Sphingomonas sp. DG1-23]|jgi:iron complex transport system substrate-binding protein|uniref:ABC transporter substrate-binding protein n=1 Tax=Sphingomonas sp. DG1-23 TaxID=3068316 RepID=UPI00273D9AB1|nr:ABC transporter substrate-binding protein [Sphingomonas sp. DG1-23]MDP5279047.1 ABC transporter substrate-binding protein [Sphingomonas sp. DG1-23]
MKRAALLCLLASGCAAQPSAKGGGIVSLNPCADAILVELVPHDRIAAISHYSRDPAASSIDPVVARRLPVNNGTAEEVIALRPDLAIIDSFTSISTREAFARAGVKTLTLGWASNIADSKAQIRDLAAALDARPAGEAMVARIDRAVAAAHTDRPLVPALLWIGGNTVSGSGTLLDEMMVKAGFSDHAAHYGLQGTGYLPIEHVVADPPQVMLVPDSIGRDPDSRAAQMRGWALARSGARVHQARFERSLVNCGGPVIARAMTRLAQVRREVGK